MVYVDIVHRYHFHLPQDAQPAIMGARGPWVSERALLLCHANDRSRSMCKLAESQLYASYWTRFAECAECITQTASDLREQHRATPPV